MTLSSSANGKVNGKAPAKLMPGDFVPEIWSAKQLSQMVFPDTKWAVPGLIPQGLTILAGSPKVGKSWLCFGLALAIANGGMALGQIPVERGGVLYLSLEDQGPRLQRRLKKLTNDWRTEVPEGANFCARWPRMGRNGLNRIYEYIQQHPETRLVIIDTLAKIRNEATNGRNAYDEDYKTASLIKEVADDCSIGIVIVHHLRKMDSSDIYEKISGSNGLTGAADGVLIVKRDRGKADAILFASGRDVEEQELGMKFDPATATWNILGDATEVRLSAQRLGILKILKNIDRALNPKEITSALGNGAKEENVKRLCYLMAESGDIKSVRDGLFMAVPAGVHVLAPTPTPTPTTPVNGHSVYPIHSVHSFTSEAIEGSERSERSERHTAFTHSPDSLACLGCGEPLPEGWYHRCPNCIELMAKEIDPD